MSNAITMSPEKRREIYRRQKPGPMTPRQLSRFLSKSERYKNNLAKIRKVAEATVKPAMTPAEALEEINEITAIPPTIPISDLPADQHKAIMDSVSSMPEMDENELPDDERRAVVESLESPVSDFVEAGPPALPCGGAEHCITKSGNRAAKPHKACA